jgi:hypothetical protein
MAQWSPWAGASLVARGRPHRRSGRPEVGGDGSSAVQDLFGGCSPGPSPWRRPRRRRDDGGAEDAKAEGRRVAQTMGVQGLIRQRACGDAKRGRPVKPAAVSREPGPAMGG